MQGKRPSIAEMQAYYNNMPEEFDLGNQFDFYLFTMGLSHYKERPEEYLILKKIFVAGVSQTTLFINGIDRQPRPVEKLIDSSSEERLTFLVDRSEEVMEKTMKFWENPT